MITVNIEKYYTSNIVNTKIFMLTTLEIGQNGFQLRIIRLRC